MTAIVAALVLSPAAARADSFPGANWEAFVGTLALADEWTRPAPLGLDATFAYERYYAEGDLFLFPVGYRVDLGLDTIRGEPHAAIDALFSFAGRLTFRGGIGGRFGPFWPYEGQLRIGGPEVHGAIDVSFAFGDDVHAHAMLRLTARSGVVFDVEQGEPIGYFDFAVGVAWMQPVGPR